MTEKALVYATRKAFVGYTCGATCMLCRPGRGLGYMAVVHELVGSAYTI